MEKTESMQNQAPSGYGHTSPGPTRDDTDEPGWRSRLWEGMARASSHVAARTLHRALRSHPSPGFVIRLWDGRELEFGEERRFTIAFRDAAALRACVGARDPARLAEAYVARRVSIEGDLAGAIELAYFLRESRDAAGEPPSRDGSRLRWPLLGRASEPALARDARDVRAHYELSDELFRLFLDERMVYSCAYFAHPGERLEDAQARKLDLVCRKLHLRPGDRLLDIGCGWGALVLWAAEHYGVHATGITLSEPQAAEARRRAEQAGLTDRVTIEVRHYAELGGETFDRVSAVGMYEHVGRAKVAGYLEAVRRALRPGGLFLNHGISIPLRAEAGTGGAFIYRHVFPGAELQEMSHLSAAMERAGLEILDVQSLRPHYAMTLREWERRFRLRRGEAARYVPDRVLRIWDLYLPGCAHAFERGWVNVHQILAAKPDERGRTDAALTREEQLLADGPLASCVAA